MRVFTLVLAAFVTVQTTAFTISENTFTSGDFDFGSDNVEIASGVFWSILNNHINDLQGNLDVDQGGALYITSDSDDFSLVVDVDGSLSIVQNSGTVAFNSVGSTISPSFSIQGESFINNGEMFFAADGQNGGTMSITSLSITNAGTLSFWQSTRASGTVSLGQMTNNGIICLYNQEYVQNTQVTGNGCVSVGYGSNLHISSSTLRFDQYIHLETSSSSIHVSFPYGLQSYSVLGFGNGNMIGLGDSLIFFGEPFFYDMILGYLTLYSLQGSQSFYIGRGYDLSLFTVGEADYGNGNVVPYAGVKYNGDVNGQIPSSCSVCPEVPSIPSPPPIVSSLLSLLSFATSMSVEISSSLSLLSSAASTSDEISPLQSLSSSVLSFKWSSTLSESSSRFTLVTTFISIPTTVDVIETTPFNNYVATTLNSITADKSFNISHTACINTSHAPSPLNISWDPPNSTLPSMPLRLNLSLTRTASINMSNASSFNTDPLSTSTFPKKPLRLSSLNMSSTPTMTTFNESSATRSLNKLSLNTSATLDPSISTSPNISLSLQYSTYQTSLKSYADPLNKTSNYTGPVNVTSTRTSKSYSGVINITSTRTSSLKSSVNNSFISSRLDMSITNLKTTNASTTQKIPHTTILSRDPSNRPSLNTTIHERNASTTGTSSQWAKRTSLNVTTSTKKMSSHATTLNSVLASTTETSSLLAHTSSGSLTTWVDFNSSWTSSTILKVQNYSKSISLPDSDNIPIRINITGSTNSTSHWTHEILSTPHSTDPWIASGSNFSCVHTSNSSSDTSKNVNQPILISSLQTTSNFTPAKITSGNSSSRGVIHRTTISKLPPRSTSNPTPSSYLPPRNITKPASVQSTGEVRLPRFNSSEMSFELPLNAVETPVTNVANPSSTDVGITAFSFSTSVSKLSRHLKVNSTILYFTPSTQINLLDVLEESPTSQRSSLNVPHPFSNENTTGSPSKNTLVKNWSKSNLNTTLSGKLTSDPTIHYSSHLDMNLSRTAVNMSISGDRRSTNNSAISYFSGDSFDNSFTTLQNVSSKVASSLIHSSFDTAHSVKAAPSRSFLPSTPTAKPDITVTYQPVNETLRAIQNFSRTRDIEVSESVSNKTVTSSLHDRTYNFSSSTQEEVVSSTRPLKPLAQSPSKVPLTGTNESTLFPLELRNQTEISETTTRRNSGFDSISNSVRYSADGVFVATTTVSRYSSNVPSKTTNELSFTSKASNETNFEISHSKTSKEGYISQSNNSKVNSLGDHTPQIPGEPQTHNSSKLLLSTHIDVELSPKVSSSNPSSISSSMSITVDPSERASEQPTRSLISIPKTTTDRSASHSSGISNDSHFPLDSRNIPISLTTSYSTRSESNSSAGFIDPMTVPQVVNKTTVMLLNTSAILFNGRGPVSSKCLTSSEWALDGGISSFASNRSSLSGVHSNNTKSVHRSASATILPLSPTHYPITNSTIIGDHSPGVSSNAEAYSNGSGQENFGSEGNTPGNSANTYTAMGPNDASNDPNEVENPNIVDSNYNTGSSSQETNSDVGNDSQETNNDGSTEPVSDPVTSNSHGSYNSNSDTSEQGYDTGSNGNPNEGNLDSNEESPSGSQGNEIQGSVNQGTQGGANQGSTQGGANQGGVDQDSIGCTNNLNTDENSANGNANVNSNVNMNAPNIVNPNTNVGNVNVDINGDTPDIAINAGNTDVNANTDTPTIALSNTNVGNANTNIAPNIAVTADNVNTNTMTLVANTGNRVTSNNGEINSETQSRNTINEEINAGNSGMKSNGITLNSALGTPMREQGDFKTSSTHVPINNDGHTSIPSALISDASGSQTHDVSTGSAEGFTPPSIGHEHSLDGSHPSSNSENAHTSGATDGESETTLPTVQSEVIIPSSYGKHSSLNGYSATTVTTSTIRALTSSDLTKSLPEFSNPSNWTGNYLNVKFAQPHTLAANKRPEGNRVGYSIKLVPPAINNSQITAEALQDSIIHTPSWTLVIVESKTTSTR